MGFAYSVCGRNFDPADNYIIRNYRSGKDEYRIWKSYIDEKSNITTVTWSLFYTKPWCKKFYLRIYVGWKLKGCICGPKDRAMTAFHINPFRIRK